MRKRVLVLVLCLVVVLQTGPVNANETSVRGSSDDPLITVNMIDMAYFYCNIDIDDSGESTVKARIEGTEANKIVLYTYLKCYKNGVWKTVKSWKTTSYSFAAHMSDTYDLDRGYQYKVVSNAYLYEDDDFIESCSTSSDKLYY